MKHLLLGLIMVCGTIVVMAQAKPAKAPSQKEMEAMKRQMQEQLNKLTPDQRKLMEQMGVQLPDMQQIDKAATIVRANPPAVPGTVPKLNAAKLAAMPAAPTAGGLGAFVSRVHQAIVSRVPAAQATAARQVLAQLKAAGNSPQECGKAAVGLWISGRPEMALLLAGEVCMTDASLAENINNYAAMLNMMDVQQAAIPLLQCINRQYPGNATILGNLGQAWFGMGDMQKAEKYLDSAIQRFPKHSQAHHTKSQIQEAKGDKKGAAESLEKSLDAAYTDEKAAGLRRLGYPNDGDVGWPFHLPQDPLGFHKFSWPRFPMNVKENDALQKEWVAFRTEMNELAYRYQQVSGAIQQQAEQQASVKTPQQMMQEAMAGGGSATAPLSARAGRKLSYLLDDKDGGITSQLEEVTEELKSLPEKLAVFDSIRTVALKPLEKMQCDAGEGTPATDKAQCCQIRDEANSQWMASCNALIRDTYTRALDVYKRLWSAQAYLYQYSMDELLVEMYKAQFKSQFAGMMGSFYPQFASPSPDCAKPKDNPFQKPGLQEFDDVACRYYSVLDFKVLKIETRCSKMTTTVDADKFGFSFTEDLNKSEGILPGAITRATVDVSVSLGSKGLGKWGPVKVEASAGADLHVELDGQGIQEVTVTVGAKVEAGTDMFENAGSIGDVVKDGGKAMMEKTGKTILLPGVDDKSVAIGGNVGVITINSGSGVVGAGVFNGLKL